MIDIFSKRIGKNFIPPDDGDICWNNNSETFTREEVAYLLWSQIAAIGNDLKTVCGDDMTPEMFDVLNNPRVPIF